MTTTDLPAASRSGARPRAAWVEDVALTGSRYIVELLDPAERTSGGIWLPERCQDNWTHGVVRGAGPGDLIGDQRTVMWLEPGDEALFTMHAFHSFGAPHRVGWVRDEDVVAYLTDGEVLAANDWVMIEQDEDEPDPSATIAYAEEWRPKPLHGRVVGCGPGLLRRTGPLAGARKPVQWLMGFAPNRRRLLSGMRVWWSRECELISMGRETLERVFVQAESLLFIEED
jgi:co-chaperonin GroES (HSP10)